MTADCVQYEMKSQKGACGICYMIKRHMQ